MIYADLDLLIFHEQSGFSSGLQQKRVELLEQEASKLAQELTQSHRESVLFASTTDLASSHPARTQQLTDAPKAVSQKAASSGRSAVELHVNGNGGNLMSALSSLAHSDSGSQPPIINIYVGHQGRAAHIAAASSSPAQLSSDPVADAADQRLLTAFEAKLEAQDREIARLLAERRISAKLHSSGGADGARMQSLSQIPTAAHAPQLHLGSIESAIDRTLAELSRAHQRLKVLPRALASPPPTALRMPPPPPPPPPASRRLAVLGGGGPLPSPSVPHPLRLAARGNLGQGAWV
jgi:hypothetical protein